MARRKDTQKFKTHEKVVAVVDLEGVPAGTSGKVVMVNGIAWIRYRVVFENGADLGFLEADQLMSRADWREATAANSSELPAPA